MKRTFWVLTMVLAVFLAGCNASAVSFDTPSDVTSGEVITESVVHDFNEKPDQQTQFVASHPVGTTVRYDLNGDGIGEDITVVTQENEAGQLTIGEVSVEIWCWTPTGYFTVVNVDDSVNRLLVGISDYGPSDDPETVLYAYDGMNIREIGYLSDILGRNIYDYEGAICHGDGTITAGRRWDVLGTWGTVGLYRVMDSVEDITEFYPYIGWEGEQGTWDVRARYDMIMFENEMAETITVVPAGSTMKMMGMRKCSKDEMFWVQFEVPEQNKTLWLLTKKVDWAFYLYTNAGFISSEEAFDGFFYAG